MDVPRRFQQFTEERKLLKNVSRNTLIGYKYAWRSFEPFIAECKDEKQLRKRLKDAVMGLMTAEELAPQSINNYIRVINAFLKWMHEEDGIPRIKLDKLKQPTNVRKILTDDEVQGLITLKPKKLNDRRVWMMSMIILDAGLRLDEVRRLHSTDIDFENFLITIRGKGNKQRRVPFSADLRKILYKWCQKVGTDHLFNTRAGKLLVSARNATRDLHMLGCTLSMPDMGFHRMRHTMATNFIKRGGNVVNLQKILGHTSVTTTMIYVHAQTEDMVKDHQHLSILSARIV